MAFQRLRRLMSESEDEEAEAQRDVDITFGIEEEFWLVDPDSRDIIADPDTGIFDWCERNRGPHGFVHELLRSQIETNTRVCESVADLRGALKETRRIVAEAASRHGAAIMAASTHPFAAWESQMTTPKERYERLATTLQESARRLLVSGMHIHAGFGDADSRIRVMTAMRRYLPLLHAISTSSPFSAGREDRVQVLPIDHHGSPSAHRPARPPVVPGRVRSTRGRVPEDEAHRRRQRAVVGHPPVGALPHHRTAHLRPVPARRRRHVHRRPLRVSHPAAVTPRPRGGTAGRAADGDHRREPLAGAALRRARVPRRHPAREAARTSRTSRPSWWRN